MALSGSLSTKYKGYTYRIDWTATQSVAGNYSDVKLTHKLICDSGWDLHIAAHTGSGTVGGVAVSYTAPKISSGGGTTTTLGTTTHRVAHNADGSKTGVAVSGVFNLQATIQGTYKASLSVSDKIDLNTIPRASQPSCITWPEHTQNVGYFGDTIAIHMNRKSDAFTHVVRFAFGDFSAEIAAGVTTGTTWTIPLDLMTKIPKSTSGSGTIYVDTYNGSAFVGTKSCGFTAKVPASVKPTCTVQVLDATDYQERFGNLVQGLSKLSVKVNGYTAYGSPIASRKATANGKTYTAAEFTTDVLVNSGTITVTATVTDQRGRTSAAASASFQVLAYTRPQITALSVHRCDQDGTENDQGEYISLTFSTKITPLNNRNSVSYRWSYKKTDDGATTFVVIEPPSGVDRYNLTTSDIFYADPDYSYEVEVEAKDAIYTETRSTSASTGFSLMDWNASGKGIAFGKVSELDYGMEVAMPLRTTGGLLPVQIEEGTDLNTIKTAGLYKCALSSIATSLLNCPTTMAFCMEVLPNIPATQRITEYIEHSSPRVFIRNYYDYTNTWGIWYELVPRQSRIGTKVNLLTLASGASYTFPSDGYLVARASYRAGYYVNFVLAGSNGTGFNVSVTAGSAVDMKGNPTNVTFVRKGMTVSSVATNDATNNYNGLEFHPVY